MVSRTRIVTGSLATWAAAVLVCGVPAQGAVAQKTATEGVYTKAQAEAGKTQFTKMCATCHPFTAAEKKKPKDVPLGEEAFVKSWEGRPLSEMMTLIVMTMPNDGSGEVTDPQAVDLVAYILQQNGFKPGDSPLTKAGADDIVIKK